MGSNQSTQARTQFQRPRPQPQAPVLDDDDDDEEKHISISNKMVERIVEDATIANVAENFEGVPLFHADSREKLLMEKLKALDDKHSERWGLTKSDMESLMARIERRTKNMISSEPVCPECKQAIVDCYADAELSHGDYTKCWGTISAFSACVRDETCRRLRARTQRDALELTRRSRHVALARENVLKDLSPPPNKRCEFEHATRAL